MRVKIYLGISFIILGIALLFSSYYIKNQVKEGRKQISQAQGTVDTGGKLFSHNPITKEVGKELLKGVQSKIDEGTRKANFYSALAFWFQIIGPILIILGIILIFIRKKKKIT